MAEHLGLHPPWPGKRHGTLPSTPLCSLPRRRHLGLGSCSLSVSTKNRRVANTGKLQIGDLMEMTHQRKHCLLSPCLGLRPSTDSTWGQRWRVAEAKNRQYLGGLGLKI